MKVDKPFIEAMRRATHLVRTQGPHAATQFIQGLFRTTPAATPAPAGPADDIIDVPVTPSDATQFEGPLSVERLELLAPDQPRFPNAPAADAPFELPDAAGQFLNKRFSNETGSRNYKLYVPSSYAGTPVPLVVMLHGCTQGPDDFAIGTRANRWAESRGCLVAYPEQMQRANSHRCWNWFRPQDQSAGRGEPELVAGITKQVIDTYAIDARRVYVAGMSAGGAMAAIVGQAYPELFTAIGIHSGVPAGAAHNLTTALAVMKTGKSQLAPLAIGRALPLIVLHGDADRTVHPENAAQLIEQAIETQQRISPGSPLQSRVQTSEATEASHAYRRTTYSTENGTSMIEYWQIQGAGHAWSGGNAAGSHTDERGPDATRVMFEFFDQHVLSLQRSM